MNTQSFRDSAFARWSALFLVSLTMFLGYFFVDVAAPLKNLLEAAPYHWSNETFGALGSSEFFLNVFAGMLIFSGVILDKMGIRFTIMLSASLMLGGGAIKWYALTQSFAATGLYAWLTANNPYLGLDLPATAELAFFGFAIFGVGVEMAGITVSKTIVRWFKGKELALAMGLEMAFARLGVFAVFQLSPIFAKEGGVENSVFFGVLFLLVGFISFLLYTFMDRKLEKSEGKEEGGSPEDEFKFSDLGKIITNPGFLAIAGLCVLFYSAIFPFQKFATDMLSNKLCVEAAVAAKYVSFFPIAAMILTPFIGAFLDRVGKGATMMMYGAIILTVSHLIFALVPSEIFSTTFAIANILILGTAFSLVPASMWPSIPKIIDEKLLGSAYGLIFFIQNIGLMAVPMLIGFALSTSNPGVAEQIQAGVEGARYDYTVPELIFACFGIAAFVLGLVLKMVDKKKGYGLDEKNIK